MVIWADVYVLLSEVFLMCATEAQRTFFIRQSVATFALDQRSASPK